MHDQIDFMYQSGFNLVSALRNFVDSETRSMLDFYRSPLTAAPKRACPDCKGTGKIMLLTSTVDCYCVKPPSRPAEVPKGSSDYLPTHTEMAHMRICSCGGGHQFAYSPNGLGAHKGPVYSCPCGLTVLPNLYEWACKNGFCKTATASGAAPSSPPGGPPGQQSPVPLGPQLQWCPTPQKEDALRKCLVFQHGHVFAETPLSGVYRCACGLCIKNLEKLWHDSYVCRLPFGFFSEYVKCPACRTGADVSSFRTPHRGARECPQCKGHINVGT